MITRSGHDQSTKRKRRRIYPEASAGDIRGRKDLKGLEKTPVDLHLQTYWLCSREYELSWHKAMDKNIFKGQKTLYYVQYSIFCIVERHFRRHTIQH